MKTSFNFQKISIDRALKLRGIDPDLVDTRSHIDRTLSLGENFTNIIGKRKQKESTSSGNKINNFLEAQEIFSNFNSKRQRIDSRINARKTFEENEMTNKNFKKWKKNPNRFDISGIDTKY